MSVENVKKLYEDLTRDETLKQKFAELSQKYQGQRGTDANTMANLEQEVFSLAAQLGYSFTMDDVKEYNEEWKQLSVDGELSDAELQAVVGGDGTTFFCFLIGAPKDGDGAKGFCFLCGEGSYNRQSSSCCLFGQAVFR